ncbi:hypothetical protein JQK87_09330 [Streptomyces sp. G44]|uniref:hypothetical protein n=1 Tax=unclassified Streptomyces TaxID=2593676 RepID=UPI001961A7E1|nr:MULTISPECIES: hypothetical protein [unclassified Streptomyces]MBM7168612.1 hypothetical protein [Streptomyces sp. G44]MCZ7456945.1 hypothetical protein [Streptomyces sp. WMMC940]
MVEASSGVDVLHQLATVVLNGHTNDLGLRAVCGCAFPCARAVLAEHNLAL